MKVGDKVKAIHTSYPDNFPVGTVGVITHTYGKVFGVTKAGETYDWALSPSQLELLPQTQELTLEQVYTHAPSTFVSDGLRKQANYLGLPGGPICSDYVFLREGQLDAIEHLNSFHTQGKQEVSIPQFLDLLTQYSQRKKEVKVQLNDLLEATVDHDKEVVNVLWKDGKHGGHDFTFQQLLDFQQALKGGGHGFVDKSYVEFLTPEFGNTLLAYAREKGVPITSSDDGSKVLSCDKTIKFGNAGYLWTSPGLEYHSKEGWTKLTIEEFVTNCGLTSPLPKLAGYEVKKVKKGEVYANTPNAPEDGFTVGCQFIPLTQFETLIETITTK